MLETVLTGDWWPTLVLAEGPRMVMRTLSSWLTTSAGVVRKKATTKRKRLEATHLTIYHSRFTTHNTPASPYIAPLCSSMQSCLLIRERTVQGTYMNCKTVRLCFLKGSASRCLWEATRTPPSTPQWPEWSCPCNKSYLTYSITATVYTVRKG